MTGLEAAADNRAKIAKIKFLYDTGKIDRDTAKTLAVPVLKRINDHQRAIAKKYNRKHYPLDFINAMR